MSEDTARLVAERGKTHGYFEDTARISQELKDVLMNSPNWRRLSVRQREALNLMTIKQARIVCGDPDHQDHWDDIAGAAELGAGRGGGSAPARFHDPGVRLVPRDAG